MTLDGGNNPFWGFETIRDVMRRGGQGPTWGMVIFGLALAAFGAWRRAPLLIGLGVLLVLLGAWPIIQGRRSYRVAEGLQRHAAREDELVAAAYRLATESTRTDARAELAALVRADPTAAEVAHRTCLARSAGNDASDAWLDAANLLARARADQASLTSS